MSVPESEQELPAVTVPARGRARRNRHLLHPPYFHITHIFDSRNRILTLTNRLPKQSLGVHWQETS